MYCLQVFGHQVRVAARHLQARMAEHTLQVKDSATPPEIVHGEGVSEGVQGSRRRIEAELFAQCFHIPKDNAPAELSTPASGKEKLSWVQVGAVAHKHPTQFEREWQASLSFSLPCDGEQEIIQVAVFDSHAKCFADSASGIEQDQNNHVQSLLVESLSVDTS